MNYHLHLLFLISVTCSAEDKFAVMAMGDLKNPKDETYITIFNDAVKDLGMKYALVTPVDPLADKTSDCNYHITYMYNVDTDKKSLTIFLSISEMDGNNNFDLSFSKETTNYAEDGKSIIRSLMKIGIDNLSIFKKMR
jgi:hypothetical protein